jgi:hypothetical protein
MSSKIIKEKSDGFYKDPEFENVFHLTNVESITESNSYLLIPSMSEEYTLPNSVYDKLKKKAKHPPSSRTMKISLRGIWNSCVNCTHYNTCAVVLLEGSDIFISHCINEDKINYGIVKNENNETIKEAFKQVASVFIDGNEHIGE